MEDDGRRIGTVGLVDLVKTRKNMRTKITIIMSACLMLAAGAAFPAETPANWTKHCGSCHGKDGKGETKAGKKVGARDQTDPKYQESFTDEMMFKAIKEGVKDKGKEKMKPFADKLTDDEIKLLVGFIRTLKR
jgi:cytochrome c553